VIMTRVMSRTFLRAVLRTELWPVTESDCAICCTPANSYLFYNSMNIVTEGIAALNPALLYALLAGA
jgi:hypothetical protein